MTTQEKLIKRVLGVPWSFGCIQGWIYKVNGFYVWPIRGGQ